MRSTPAAASVFWACLLLVGYTYLV